jgi:hypothetical protein
MWMEEEYMPCGWRGMDFMWKEADVMEWSRCYVDGVEQIACDGVRQISLTTNYGLAVYWLRPLAFWFRLCLSGFVFVVCSFFSSVPAVKRNDRSSSAWNLAPASPSDRSRIMRPRWVLWRFIGGHARMHAHSSLSSARARR